MIPPFFCNTYCKLCKWLLLMKTGNATNLFYHLKIYLSIEYKPESAIYNWQLSGSPESSWIHWVNTSVVLTSYWRVGFKFPVRRNHLSEYILCPLTERGSLCFSGCQVCLAVQCKQIAAFTLFSQHLTSTVSQLNVLHHLQLCCSATQVCFGGDAGVKLVERTDNLFSNN